MGRQKIFLFEEIPDEEFEKEIMKEIDSSRVQEQYYLGIYTVSGKTIPGMQEGEESVRIPYRRERTAEDMLEMEYFTPEEKNDIAEKNMKLIDKCVGQFMPRTNADKKLYCTEDIVEACQMGFINALNEYPRNSSTAKFSTFAYELMSNECRDAIKRAKAKKRGLLITDSLDAPSMGASGTDEDAKTLGEMVGVNMHGEETEKVVDSLTMESLILSAFRGMDRESVLILTYRFGIGRAEYEHTEAEISNMIGLPPSLMKKRMEEAITAFKYALFRQGLMNQAEDILIRDMGYTKDEIANKMGTPDKKSPGKSPSTPGADKGDGGEQFFLKISGDTAEGVPSDTQSPFKDISTPDMKSSSRDDSPVIIIGNAVPI